jgi:SNF2 family DNA or RNA helicase
MTIILYQHQLETYDRLVKEKYLLIGSEQGTGKSFPAIKLACELKRRCVIVSPAYLCENWYRETKVWDENADVSIFPKMARITIISYDRAYKSTQLFQSIQCLILDEVQKIANLSTKRTKAIHEAVKLYRPEYVGLLSGTPMRNRVPELYSPLTLLDYGREMGFKIAFPSQFMFNMTFCEMFNQKIGFRSITQFRGCKNEDLLKKWLQPAMIRYKLDECTDIPEVVYCNRTINADVDRDLELLMGTSVDRILEGGWENIAIPDTPPAHIMSAKMESAMMKAPSTVEIVLEELESNNPIVVFSDHVRPVHMMAEALREKKFKVATITGSTPMKERDNNVQAFQAGKLDVLIGTIGAMSTGITLTKSRVCIFNDMSWVPADNMQAVGRIRRITQTRKCLVIQVTRKGIDSKITRMLNEKAKTIKSIIDSASPS